MNPFTYIKQKREEKQRKRKAFQLLVLAGTVRPADHDIRREMTEKEMAKLMREES